MTQETIPAVVTKDRSHKNTYTSISHVVFTAVEKMAHLESTMIEARISHNTPRQGCRDSDIRDTKAVYFQESGRSMPILCEAV